MGNVKGIYRFLDTQTNKTFEGTRDEYAEYLGLKPATIKSRLYQKRILAKRVGEIKGKQKPIIKEYINASTKQCFKGTRKEALKFFGIKDWKLSKMLKEGEMVSRFPVDVNDVGKAKKVAEMSEEEKRIEKIRRKTYREQCLLKALCIGL